MQGSRSGVWGGGGGYGLAGSAVMIQPKATLPMFNSKCEQLK